MSDIALKVKFAQTIKLWNDWTCIICAAVVLYTLATCRFAGNFWWQWQESDPETAIRKELYRDACKIAVVGAMVALCFELAVVFASTTLRASALCEDDNLKLRGLDDAYRMVFIYTILAGFYIAMLSWGGDAAHTDNLAFGGPRPVYTLRYVEWSIVVPVLIAIGSDTDPFG
ncbi:unnamed protein product, partial [Polarella glacialis]